MKAQFEEIKVAVKHFCEDSYYMSRAIKVVFIRRLQAYL